MSRDSRGNRTQEVDGSIPFSSTTPLFSHIHVPLAYHAGQMASSCLTKGNHRVHFRRPACREIAGQGGHCE